MNNIFRDSEGRLVDIELQDVRDYKDYDIVVYYTDTKEDVSSDELDYLADRYWREIDDMVKEYLAGQAEYYYES